MSSGTSASRFGSRYAPEAGAHGVAALSYADPIFLLGRLLLGGIFVFSGYGKILGLAAFAATLEKRGVPYASVLAAVGACVEFFGGLAVVLGIEVRYAAVLMGGFVIVATLISHRFWELEGAARQAQQVQFLKNVAIIGGFVLLHAAGGGRLALERLWRRS
jgi:putative oxidoreductase